MDVEGAGNPLKSVEETDAEALAAPTGTLARCPVRRAFWGGATCTQHAAAEKVLPSALTRCEHQAYDLAAGWQRLQKNCSRDV
ncbi:hypothetical protein CgunFtcFv8_020127 [Champsocephalus gunnari]|uniref:Uncharacterized protein n=1 Tax=Champsocephalus gunnari TaxID=52237 RepID=A0AAN8DJ88_CHAGU|nr:hypothetical protein CgunFtcFv8_020127 [Champsocephalus gunnari]